MKQSSLTRRQLVHGLGAAAAVGLGAGALPGATDSPIIDEPFPQDVDQALARLIDGNRRFVAGQPRYPHTGLSWRKHLEKAQRPFATILSCSDSRVPPELLFDQGFGDLFIIRVAGHVVSDDVLGSLQYALVHLKTPLFLVLGHESCGAVTAAVQALTGEDVEPEKIRELLEMIEPGLKALDLQGDRTQVIAAAVEANVHWTIHELSQALHASGGATANAPQIAGAVYQLNSGKVDVLQAP